MTPNPDDADHVLAMAAYAANLISIKVHSDRELRGVLRRFGRRPEFVAAMKRLGHDATVNKLVRVK